jgi:hypothetical protein
MGLFKKSKDETDRLMQQQQSLMGQALAHQAAATGDLAPQPGGLDPIAGVDLAVYAGIVKAIAPHNYDQSLLPAIAAEAGVDAESWQLAHDGWNQRIQNDPAVARAFNVHYRAV